ncbi:MAG: hypothetical protein OXL37_13745 [Chloroflexota bacterium]|nr:hypothetical protein [Chloroflexota bacterium]MDE2961807.1 hypothetical protein [Chloroflexota bacterium]
MPEQNRWWSRFNDVTSFWRAPVIAGVVTGVGAWLVWYFTKVPCIMENAAAGLCNPGVLASYINLPALASCLAIGGGFATFAGGYNIIMLNRERQRADEAEARLQAERERYERLMDELRDELREERRQSAEERRQAVTTQQAMMTTLAEISATLARLAEQQNGHRASGD